MKFDQLENFADGKKKGKSRPGRVKRSGASCKGSVTSLRAKAKKYSGERGKMYHWCANMKSGKKKKNEDVTQSQLNSLEAQIDKAFGNLGIDVNFTRHFIDRVNDARNKTPISIEELARLFAKEYKRWGKPIAQMGPDKEAVLKDLESDINIPFVMKWDRENNELDMIAKTVMRKKNFQTRDQEFPVENVPNTNKPGSIGHNINWGGKNAPEKPKSNITIAKRKTTQDPQSWWSKMIGKGRQMFGLNDDINDEMTFEDDDAFYEAFGVLGYSIDETDTFEAEYRGRKVKLNKPMQGDVKKFKVYVKDPKTGNVKKVNFGHGGSSVKGKSMRIRKSNPKARKSFRARHNCDNPGPKTKARYWSCRKW
jgi:hypothetical protein|tara:strand:+ start:2626 stop:3723 length:1098 start_codon:yes stop_codon:yes gene_type:complete